MPEKLITYCGQTAKVNCDGRCHKAWGINNRPKIQLSDNVDDYKYYPDDDLPDAPGDPGTYEGGIAKPSSAEEFLNKWCVRECERCNMSDPGEYDNPLEVKNFDGWVHNIQPDAPTD